MHLLIALLAVGTALLGSSSGAQSPAPPTGVPVAARRIARGTVLTVDDITTRGMRTDSALPIGWVARRVIEAGEPLQRPGIAPVPLIAAGQPVLYVVLNEGIRLTMDGRAMQTGSLGERITVRLGANRRVDGTVTGAGEVSASALTRTP